MFSYDDAIQSKYYFDRIRIKKDLWFDWHYNILESVLKNTFVIQQLQQIIKEPEPLRVLDLGCGNGHICRSASKTIRGSFVGFDSNISIYMRAVNFRYLLSNLRYRQYSPIRYYKLDHLQFFSKYSGKKFDAIIDNCSVTHFDTRPKASVNFGWEFIAETLPNFLVKEGIFICATDVGTNLISSNEFCTENNIKALFVNKGWTLSNKDYIEKSIQSDSPLLEMFGKHLQEPFLRLPPPGTLTNGLLGITGFTAQIF